MTHQDNVFGVDPETHTTVYIDGNSLHGYAVKHGRGSIDFAKFRDFIDDQVLVHRLNFFGTFREDDDGHDPARKTLDWCSYNGYTVHSRVMTKTVTGETRTTLPTALASHMVNDAHMLRGSPHIMMLFGNRLDYVEPLTLIKQLPNVKLVVVGGAPNAELRRLADSFVDFSVMCNAVTKERRENPVRSVVGSFSGPGVGKSSIDLTDNG